MRTRLKVIAAMSLLAVSIQPALGVFHLMKVVEVFPGTAAAPNAQYVVIQMYTSGQNLVSGHVLTVYNAAGVAVDSFTFEGNVANGASQAKILIATPQAENFFGLDYDLAMSGSLLSAGGKVCFETIDCVAWGAYTGSATGVGTPFNAASGLQSGRAAIRRLDIAGSASVLDAADDTNNSANDFVFGLPAPRNNAGVLGVVPAATCGNGALEGLEQCDDNNLSNGDGCSSTCNIDQVISRAPGDYDGDGKSDVVWRNTSTGANVIWKSGKGTTQQAMTGVVDLNWKIVGRGDFDGDGKSDVFWRNIGTGANVIWKSAKGTTQQAVTGVTNQVWQVVGVGDFNNDGRSDLLWRNASTGTNVIWRSANGATQQGMASLSNLWKVVAVGDFDGDGKSDVFWRNTGTGANTIWKSGNAATQQATAGVTNQSWKVVNVGDFDGDGKSDVFWRNVSTGANVIWKSGKGTTQQAVTGVTNQAWQVVNVGDFDGDGKSDVFWRNVSTGANVIWKSGKGTTQQAVTGVTNQAWQVVNVGDFDGDGRSDAFWRNSSTGANAIWRSGNAATQLAVSAVTNQAWKVVPREGQTP